MITAIVLEQLGDKQRQQIRNYREYVERTEGDEDVNDPPPTINQLVIGDKEFAERVLNKRRVSVPEERAYLLSDVEEAVCRMTRIDREELRRSQRRPEVKQARELFMYLARRYTGASLREIADRLGVRDISTVSHGEKRISNSLREKSADSKELKRVLDETYSLIQA